MFGLLKNKKQIQRELNEYALSIEKLMSHYEYLLDNNLPEHDRLIFAKLWATKALQYQTYQKSYKHAKKLASHNVDPDDYLIEMDSEAFDIWSIQTMYGLESARETCIEIYLTQYGENSEKTIQQDFMKAIDLIKHQLHLV